MFPPEELKAYYDSKLKESVVRIEFEQVTVRQFLNEFSRSTGISWFCEYDPESACCDVFLHPRFVRSSGAEHTGAHPGGRPLARDGPALPGPHPGGAQDQIASAQPAQPGDARPAGRSPSSCTDSIWVLAAVGFAAMIAASCLWLMVRRQRRARSDVPA